MVLFRYVEEKEEKKKEKIRIFFSKEEEEIKKFEKENEIKERKEIDSFSNCVEKEERKEMLKFLGLPLKKNLRYMRKKAGEWKEDKVLSFDVVREWSECFTLALKTESFGTVTINSLFFSHMQKPSFSKDIEEGKEE